jgi:hypothetical protein
MAGTNGDQKKIKTVMEDSLPMKWLCRNIKQFSACVLGVCCPGVLLLKGKKPWEYYPPFP